MDVLLSAKINILQNIFVVQIIISYFTYTSSQDLRMDNMSYPVVTAIVKQFILKFYRGVTPPKQELLPPETYMLKTEIFYV